MSISCVLCVCKEIEVRSCVLCVCMETNCEDVNEVYVQVDVSDEFVHI